MSLKSGYTTGTCVTIGTKAVLKMIFEQKAVYRESVITPKGIKIETDIYEPDFGNNYGCCGVKKYSGDDPDVTNGIMLYVKVTLNNSSVVKIDGGIGVGRVTKKGLEQPIGQAAINKVPREMITKIVGELFDFYGYEGGADILITVPQGEEIAKKTFNSRLGIEGGISILGTSGIVEPMSEQAIIDTIKAELSVKKANEGDYVMLAPGNYGLDFIRNNFNVDLNKAVKFSNFVGEALDFVKEKEFKGVVVIGHIGKLVKVAGGIMNTHSKNADCRMEILASNTALYTEDISLIRQILACTTTDEAIELLKNNGILDLVMKKIIERISFYINNRLENSVKTEIIIFSNVYGILSMTEGAENMLLNFKEV